ncbi:MAG: hypothetical protein JXB29_11040 [Sedimentisphaerales bacterium]|nr:hypothetical protein [Sedimentisphaerales bacterium]
MNYKQKFVILAGLGVIAVIAAFPPVFEMASKQSTTGVPAIRKVVNYKFVFDVSSEEINYNRLMLQCLVVLIIIILTVFALSFGGSRARHIQVFQAAMLRKELVKHENEIKKRGKSEEKLRRRVSELTFAKEMLTKRVEQQAKEINAAKEELNQIISQSDLPEDLVEVSLPIEEASSKEPSLNRDKLRNLAEFAKRLT